MKYRVEWKEERVVSYHADIEARNEEHARHIIEEDLDDQRVDTEKVDEDNLREVNVTSVEKIK